MNQHFKAVSISYKTSPVGVREKLALDEQSAGAFLLEVSQALALNELLVVSTCNRTEIYYRSEEDHSQTLVQMLCLARGIGKHEELLEYFEQITDSLQAVNHLFRVSVGLESQVVGDLQIANQVKKAYQLSADLQLAGAFLHRLMHTIFYCSKQIVQQTSFRDGAASVSYATTELVSELAQSIVNPRILLIGTGEMGADVIKNLADTSLKDVRILNRTYTKAQELAQVCGFEAFPFETLKEQVQWADIIVSSVATQAPIINEDTLQPKQLFSYKYFIDLSVPRSIDNNLEQIPGVLLYNVDQINTRTKQALSKRLAAIPEVETIVRQSIADFSNWSQESLVSPTINKLKNALEDIRKQEISKYLKQLDAQQEDLVDKITKGILQKIIKLPVIQLKAACKRGEAENLVGALVDIFNLEQEKTTPQC